MSGTDAFSEAARWLRYAREDMTAAASLRKDEAFVPRHVCWLAQQAAEKAIKAALVSLQSEFPRTHDLDLLCNLLPDDWSLHRHRSALAQLSEWAVEARYPGDWSEATIGDAELAVTAAQSVIQSITVDLANRKLDGRVNQA